MKQRVSVEQLSELSEKAKERLRGWWSPQHGDTFNCTADKEDYVIGVGVFYDEKKDRFITNYIDDCDVISRKECLPLLSIGQLIEFLDPNMPKFYSISKNTENLTTNETAWQVPLLYTAEKELCDSLWAAVKSTLEQDEAK